MNWAVIFFLTPVLSGVFVAPWLTLLCRSALAGAVFAFALPPFLFWVLSELIAMARFGFDYYSSIEIQNFKTGVFRLLLLARDSGAIAALWRVAQAEGRGPRADLGWAPGAPLSFAPAGLVVLASATHG